MAFTGITATEAEIDQKSGAGVSASFTDTMKTQSLLQAESYLNVETGYNWSDAFSSLNADVKYLVTAFTSSWVALDAINYDTSGYLGPREAETMMDVLSNIMRITLKTLSDKNKQAWAVAVT